MKRMKTDSSVRRPFFPMLDDRRRHRHKDGHSETPRPMTEARKLRREIAWLKRRQRARDLCESVGVPCDAILLEALAGLADDGARRRFVEREKAFLAKLGGSLGRGLTARRPATEEDVDGAPEDVAEIVYFLREGTLPGAQHSPPHAPKGGATIQGKHFSGGEFIPTGTSSDAADDEEEVARLVGALRGEHRKALPMRFPAPPGALGIGTGASTAEDGKGHVSEAQKTAIQGVDKVRCDDVAGPDVDDWYPVDLVDQIEYRARQQRDLFRTALFPGPFGIVGGDPTIGIKDAENFAKQAAYGLAYKWMNLRSPRSGKGVNTVVLAGRPIRKNQLGNIAFTVLSDLFPVRGPKGERPVPYVYGNERVGTYWKDHPYSKNYGDFVGAYRADNLAAFGVGHGIAKEIDSMPIMKTLRKRIADGFLGKGKLGKPILSDAEKAEFAADLKKIITDRLHDEEWLRRRVNKHHDLLKENTGEDTQIPVRTLFFVPAQEKGNARAGFNTESLKLPRGKVYDKTEMGARDYFDKVLRPEYEKYKKATPHPVEIDEWLRRTREDYTKSEPQPPG